MLLERTQSCLLLIDVQEKLTPLVLNSTKLLSCCQWLLKLALELNIPCILTEQYPKGLGSTVPVLKNLLPQQSAIEKNYFSCFHEPVFKNNLISLNKKQLLLIGIEAHVCILQTAIDLMEANYDVFVAVDAISSRFALDKNRALQRMEHSGIQLITAEMVFFEWLRQANGLEFKNLSKTYLNRLHQDK